MARTKSFYKMNDSLSLFGLTPTQTQILFSLQHLIIKNDINAEENKDLNDIIKVNEGVNKWATKFRGKPTEWLSTKEQIIQHHQAVIDAKKRWLQEWADGIEGFLKLQEFDHCKLSGLLKTQLDIIDAIVDSDSSLTDDTWKYLLLLECCLFEPYYPLNEQSAKDKDEILDKCELNENDELLKRICEILCVDNDLAPQFKKDYKRSVNLLSGKKQRIIKYSAIAVTSILASIILFQPYLIFAAAGTAGAAAFTSALAALGGGAIAAGGFGMAGGIAVLVGGGSLIGVLAGHGAGAYVSKLSVNATLRETAKMNVMLEDVILGINKNVEATQSVLIEITKRMQELRQTIIELQVQAEKDQQQIKDLDKKISILECLLRNSRGFSY